MSIPKKIHYCWLSGEPFPAQIQKCIDSWHEHMPEYEFKLWDMNSFDVDSVPYVKQAVDKRKWAFASDYLRLFALFTEGGIYLDSDILVSRSFDDLLEEKAFTAFESGGRIAAWIFASQAQNPLFKELLDYYDGRSFLREDGTPDLTPNTIPTTHILVKHGLKAENTIQRLGDITVFSEDFFCPRNPWTGRRNDTENTHAEHLFLGGWMDDKDDEAFMREAENHLENSITGRAEQCRRDGVYIYGAGIVGHLALEHMRRKFPDILVNGFIVSNNEFGWDEIENVPVYLVDDDNVDRDVPVLIATIPKHKNAIMENLIKNRYEVILEL